MPVDILIYASIVAELLKLANRIRDKAKREGITDEQLDAAIKRFDPENYQDPLDDDDGL